MKVHGGLALGALIMAMTWLAQAQDPPADQPGEPAATNAAAEPLPPRALGRFGTTQWRHGSRIQAIAFAPSGKLIAAAGGNDPIRFWDAASGREVRTCNEPWTYALAFSTRGTVLFSAGALKIIRMWETETGKEFAQLTGHEAAIKALAVSPDGSMLASGSVDGTIILWEVIHRKVMVRLKGHTDEVTSLAFSPDRDSTYLVSGSRDRTLRVWHVDGQTMVQQIDAGLDVASVAFVDDTTVAAAGDTGAIKLFNAPAGKLLHELPGHEGSVEGLVVSRDGKRLISSSNDGSIRVWDIAQRKSLLKIDRHPDDGEALALSKDGVLVACGGSNNTLRVFDTETGQERLANQGLGAGLTHLALASDHKTLASITSAGTVAIWDRASGKQLRSWPTPHRQENVLAFTPDGQLLATGSRHQPVRFWDAATGKEAFQLEGKQDDPFLCFAFAPNNTWMAIGHRSGAADVWDYRAKRLVQQCKLPVAGGVQAAAFAADSGLLALAGLGKIALWNVPAGKEVRVFDTKAEVNAASLPAVASLAFAVDGKTLAAGCYDGAVRLFDHTNGTVLRELEGHGSVPYALAFSRDGRILASGSFDKTTRLWEAFSGLMIASLQGHRGPVYGVALTPDGRHCYSASADTTMLHWDVTGRGPDGLDPAKNPIIDLAGAWNDLASEDTARGHRAMWLLVANAQHSVPYLGKQVFLVDPAEIEQLFKDLNADRFDVRNKATKELEKYGRWMEGRFKQALTNPPTLEVQRRLEQLLDKLKSGISLNQERIRVRRAMLIMEQSGGPAARQVLESLVAGAPERELQQEARQTLERLAKRDG